MAKFTKTALIVFAHQEPKSFNGALRDTAEQTLMKLGFTVEISDLYAQEFDARATKHDFTGDIMMSGTCGAGDAHSSGTPYLTFGFCEGALKNPDHFVYNLEAAHAYKTSGLCAEIQAEVEKLRRADVIVFQFPMYWLSVPAILKGWFDRVLVPGFAFGIPHNTYDNGYMKGKKTILSLTTGSPAPKFTDQGLNGDINVALWPIHYGTLKFCGFDVLKPQVSYSPVHAGDSQRKQMLTAWKDRLETLETESPLLFVPTSNFNLQNGSVLSEEFIKENASSGFASSIGHHIG